jgi:hypothetical protein
MKTAVFAGMGLLALVATTGAQAQQNFNGVRVMVAADDSDANSVIRSSDMYHRGQIPLNEELKRYGYTAVFQDAMVAELQWTIPDRAPKSQTLSMVKAACESAKSTLCPRVVALVRTQARANDLGFGTQVEVRMSGELIDASTNAYLGGWEAPSQKFNAPKNCNALCTQDVVGENARQISLTLADTLRKMLDQQALTSKSAATPGAVSGGGKAPGSGLVNTFFITFEHFELSEVLPVKGIMESEFPQTEEVTNVGSDGIFKLNLTTRAKADKVHEWLALMLEDRGYNLRNVKITAKPDGSFVIDRIVDDGYRPARPSRVYR